MKNVLLLLSTVLIFISCSTNNNGTVTVVPIAPTNLTGSVISTSQVNLSWTDNATNEDGYKIERKSGSGSYAVVGSMGVNLTTFSDLGLTPNTTYTYRVYAYNSAGNSLQYSNEVTVTTQDNIPSWLTNGLVAFYPFSGNAGDSSGNGNHGTVNGATLSMDRFGNTNKAYSFNNNYIIVPNSNSFDYTDFSVSFWIKTNNASTQVPITQLKYTDASDEKFSFALNYNGLNRTHFACKYNIAPSCTPGVGWILNEHTINVSDNTFHHITGTVEGNTMKFYIDGNLLGSVLGNSNQSSNCFGGDIQIGRCWNNFPNYFNGTIDDIRIYNRPLSQSEVTYLATH